MMRRILIPIGYLVLAAALVLVTVGLVAYGQGIEYDFKTGRIIHTGLVIIQSEPAGAEVVLNGKKLNKKKTPYRKSFEEGTYNFELVKDGFHTWRKALKVVSSEVTMAQYALLVPKKPEVATLDTKPQIAVQNISKDHRHLAYITSGAEAAVYALDLDGSKPVKIYTPKAAAPDQPAETLLDVIWSDDASHVLVVAQAGPAPVHYLMAADGSGVVNLTQQYGFNFSGVKFSANNWRQLYWVSPDGLRRLDVGAQSVSGVLADKVSQFHIADDRVLYIQAATLNRTLWSLDSRGNKKELIQALPDSDSYALAFATYRGEEQLAIVPARTHIGTLYSGIYGTNPVAKTIAHDITDVSFSPDGHLLAFSSPTHVTTYDLERSTLTGKLVSYEAGGLNAMTGLTWFDNFHLLQNQNGRLILSEYDGANAVDLGALQGQIPAYGSSDGQSIVAFRPGNTGATVNVVQIIVKP